ncbi:MAG: phage portal protein [Candidatus Omnitrophica bacterium]|nr:phage portal protein [Candidatus Omnitrophota bacterium]
MMGILTDMLERRSGMANPEKWLKDFFGGRESHSGIAVNETSALSSTAVFACIRLLSDTLASLPCPVYKRKIPRGKERAQDYPLYKLIHTRANPIMPAFTWRETMMGHILGWGNCYSEMEYGENGYPIALWPLRPDRTQPERDKVTKELYYITQIDGIEYKLPKNRVLHIPGLGFDGIKGYSPITIAREAIGLSLATEEFGARYFGSGTHPGAVVTRPLDAPILESQEAITDLRNYLVDAYGGLGKSHRLMLLEEGMDIKNIGIPPEDSQFLETRQFQVTEIARFFGVQPHLIGDLTKSTNNNIEEQAIEFVVYTLRPWLVRWESYLNLDLIPEEHQNLYFCEFLVDGLLRGDAKSRSEALQTRRRNGTLSANEWREIENENPLPGDLGDIYIVESNMQSLEYLVENPGGSGNKPQTQPKTDSNQQKSLKIAYERLFSDALNRIFKRENADIQREIKREDFENWTNGYYKEPPEFIEKNLLPVYLSYFEAKYSDISPENEQKAKDLCGNFSKKHCERARKTILEGKDLKIEEAGLIWKELNENE